MLTTMERRSLPWVELAPIPGVGGPFITLRVRRWGVQPVRRLAAQAGVAVETTYDGILNKRLRVSGTHHNLELFFNYALRELPGFYERMKEAELL